MLRTDSVEFDPNRNEAVVGVNQGQHPPAIYPSRKVVRFDQHVKPDSAERKLIAALHARVNASLHASLRGISLEKNPPLPYKYPRMLGGLGGGMMGGVALGACAGVAAGFIFPGIGNIIGLVVGIFVGLVAGGLLGMIVGALGDTCKHSAPTQAVLPPDVGAGTHGVIGKRISYDLKNSGASWDSDEPPDEPAVVSPDDVNETYTDLLKITGTEDNSDHVGYGYF